MGKYARNLAPNTCSVQTSTTVQKWIQECSEHHRCLSQANPEWYPTRLLERLSHETFRVIHSDSSLFQHGHGYITLSHRWGDSNFVKLTKANLLSFENGLPIKNLRKIFQDTLVFAQSINIRYVWIDSLCIIQSGDNGADWRQESTAMAEVYSNSLCNIAADWGDESHGLFFERSPPFDNPYTLQLEPTFFQVPVDSLGSPQSHIMPNPPQDVITADIVGHVGWYENVMESPLNRRGWVLQERLLAPRVLHFSPQQVLWECGQKVTCERAPWNFLDDKFPEDTRKNILNDMKRLNLHEPTIAVDWPALVSFYSGCDLTTQSDRLVAIAGIAKRLCPVVKDQYVTGLWVKLLPRALLWHRQLEQRTVPIESGEKALRSPLQYYAPTFSWAAADGRVSLMLDQGLATPQITTPATFIRHRKKALPGSSTQELGASLEDEILTDNVFAPFMAPEAELRLRGILRSCHRVWQQSSSLTGSEHTYAYPTADVERCVHQGSRDNCAIFEVIDDRVCQEDMRVNSTIHYYTVIECFPDIGVESSAFQGYRAANGLLLKSVDASMGRFERVGHIRHFRHGTCSEPDILQPLGNEQDLPAWSYDAVTGEHTFYIV